MGLRGRYLKTEFWEDATVQRRMGYDERLTYIGLWSYADDAAWLKWDLPQIAGVLYRFHEIEAREELVARTLATLIRLKKARKYRCGHVHLVSMEKHLRHGKRQFSVLAEHQEKCLGSKPSKGIQTESKGIKSDQTHHSHSQTQLNSTEESKTRVRSHGKRDGSVERLSESEFFRQFGEWTRRGADSSRD